VDLELEWTPWLGVGIVGLDEDHRALISCYNNLVGTLCGDGRRRAFLPAFERLLGCADYHFAHEELVMRNIRYAGYRAHKAEHDRLRANAHDFVLNVEGAYTRRDLPVVAKYFRYWLVNHIVTHDKQIGAFVEHGWEAPALASHQRERESLCQQQARCYLC
jgi:hemerythrin-like metal-binding protein